MTKAKENEPVIGAPPVEPEAAAGNSYTPKHDVLETLPDGRQIVIAAGGRPVPMSRAKELGLIKGGAKTQIETK